MFKFIAVILLTVHAAFVFGIMTIDDLPQEMGNCLENIVSPAIRERQSARENCENLPDDEVGQCSRNVEEEFHSKGISECLSKRDELPRTQGKFVLAYLMNEYAKNSYEKIPKNMRDCLDSLKSMAQSGFQDAKDCEALLTADESNEDSEKNNPYEECVAKIEDIFENPQGLNCIEIAKTLTSEQGRLLEPYFMKGVFNL